MGGILRRIEFFISGKAYQQALSAMRATKKRRDLAREAREYEENIAVTASTWVYIEPFFEGDPYVVGPQKSSLAVSNKDPQVSISSSSGYAEFYFLKTTKTSIKLSKSDYLAKQNIDERKIKRVQIQLKSYIPAAFRHFAHIKDDKLLYAHGSHLKQTVVAMAIELN